MKSKIRTELITAFIETNKLSKSAFCKKCKISPATLKKIFDGKDNLRIPALFKITRMMKIKINDLFM